MAPTLTFIREVRGSNTTVANLSNADVSLNLGSGTDDEVDTVIQIKGTDTRSNVAGYIHAINALISDVIPDKVGNMRGFARSNVRALMSLQLPDDTYPWQTEITGGYAAAGEGTFKLQGLANSKGYANINVRHKPYWWRSYGQMLLKNPRSPSGTTSGIVLDNDDTAGSTRYNYFGGNTASLSEFGDLPAMTTLSVYNATNDARKITRVFMGLLNGAQSYNSKITTWSSTAVNAAAYPAQVTAATASVSMVQQLSGLCQYFLRLDSAPTSDGMQWRVNNGEWMPVLLNHAISPGDLQNVSALRASVAQANMTHTLYVRNVSNSNATLPAGTLHLLPADQVSQMWLSTGAGYQQTIHRDGPKDFLWLDKGDSTALYRPGTKRGNAFLLPPSDLWCIAALVELDDGTAPATRQFTVQMQGFPCRRTI